MIALPTFRRKVLGGISLMAGLYAGLGLGLVISVNIASKTTPKLLHVNYDSISAAHEMQRAWFSAQFPNYVITNRDAPENFEKALRFAESNVTETGEKEIVNRISTHYEAAKGSLGHLEVSRFNEMNVDLSDLVSVNERGMFRAANANEQLSRKVMIASLIYFGLSLILAIFIADGLAHKLSEPLKNIVEALHRRSKFSEPLILPKPPTLELLILTTELQRLWQYLSEVEQMNVAEVLQQKDKLETLLESVEDALLVLDENGIVSHCNQCLSDLVGLKRSQIQGKRWTDLGTAAENYVKLRGTLRMDMAEGSQLDLAWKNGNSVFSARSRRIGADFKKPGILYLLHDITEKKQREKFRAEFIDLLSHELKTPLQSLGTASEILVQQRKMLPEHFQILVDTISEDVERIRGVAQEFVQITQSQSKIMKLKLETVSLEKVLPEWIKPFTVVARDRGVTILFQNESPDGVKATVDQVKFPWVISNILGNAVRFSPNQGKVMITLRENEGWIDLQIEDEGPGIPEAEQDRIFEPFYQSPMTTGSGARGLFGIGLTIAREVVEAHDGKIRYEQVLPHGSRFKIQLPRGENNHG